MFLLVISQKHHSKICSDKVTRFIVHIINLAIMTISIAVLRLAFKVGFIAINCLAYVLFTVFKNLPMSLFYVHSFWKHFIVILNHSYIVTMPISIPQLFSQYVYEHKACINKLTHSGRFTGLSGQESYSLRVCLNKFFFLLKQCM